MSDKVAAIVLAGGRGSRIQHDVNKVYLPIGERDMLEYSLETMCRAASVDRVVLVVRGEDRARAENLIAEIVPAKLTNVVIGGATRHESEQAGLEALATDIMSGDLGIVAIHDGARPFMTLDLLEATIAAARERGGAIPGLRVHETLYRVDNGDTQALPKKRCDAFRRRRSSGLDRSSMPIGGLSSKASKASTPPKRSSATPISKSQSSPETAETSR